MELDWGSQSTSRVGTPLAAKLAARLMLVVVFPTPPFWLAMAMTRDMAAPSADKVEGNGLGGGRQWGIWWGLWGCGG